MTALEVRSDALVELYRRASPQQRGEIEHMHHDLERRIREQEAIVEPGQVAGIAMGLHQLVDEAVAVLLQREPGGRVTCRRGCSACCRLSVSVTVHEAKLAVLAAEDAGWPIDVDRVRLQSTAHGAKAWRSLPVEAQACVFLTDAGECAIYPHRPIACRKYLVVNDPADCDTIRKPGHRVEQAVSAHAEVAFSAALAASSSGPLASMLLSEIEGGPGCT